jgi:hypothetical protein
MSDLDHARSLLEMAKGDLNALRGMTSPALALIPELFSDEVFGFHAQQAVEKCLKAWIASLDSTSVSSLRRARILWNSLRHLGRLMDVASALFRIAPVSCD